MKRIILMSLFFTTQIYAKDLLSISRINNKLILASTDCILLNLEAQNLVKWRNQRNEKPIDTIKISKNGKGCSLELKNIAPDFVEKYHGQNAKGPNCWNTTLTLNGMLPGKRFSQAEEMTLWMQSPLCQKVPSNQLQVGDIGAMRYYKPDNTFSETHGFIYISDNLVFHKPGPGAEESYGIYDRNKMFNESKINVSGIRVQTDYFRCSSLEDYFRNKPLLDLRYQKINQAIQAIECDEEKKIFNKKSNSEWLEINIAILDKLIADETQEAMKIPDDSKFLWHSLLVRIQSLKSQLRIDKL